MQLSTLCSRYRTRFLQRHAKHTTPAQFSALNALQGCHTAQYGELTLTCQACSQQTTRYRSCGHRFCNQCQQHSTHAWLDRQRQKLLPVDYYLVTFTLPYELRALAKAHSATVFTHLMQCAAATLKRFGLNKKGFAAELGMCAVLHTHTRRLDFHPHVHLIVPGGGIHVQRREWRKLKGQYLFNQRALAKVFRGSLLHALDHAGLQLPKTPEHWVAHCENVGCGEPALQYLSRYLYRGVISNSNLLHDDGYNITFRYQDSKTQTWQHRTLPGEDFIALLLQHVLPTGLRRVRDYGFLHANAKALLRLLHWVLRVVIPSSAARTNARFRCPHCQGDMRVIAMHPPAPLRPG